MTHDFVSRIFGLIVDSTVFNDSLVACISLHLAIFNTPLARPSFNNLHDITAKSKTQKAPFVTCELQAKIWHIKTLRITFDLTVTITQRNDC